MVGQSILYLDIPTKKAFFPAKAKGATISKVKKMIKTRFIVYGIVIFNLQSYYLFLNSHIIFSKKMSANFWRITLDHLKNGRHLALYGVRFNYLTSYIHSILEKRTYN